MDTVKILAIVGGGVGILGFSLLVLATIILDPVPYFPTPIVGIIASAFAVFAPFYFDRDIGLIIIFAAVAAISIVAGDITGLISGGLFIAAAVKTYSERKRSIVRANSL